jgi:hypothetical protein
MLDDYRAVGKGNSRGEIKIVPSPSYNDYNLYWYAKSFEIGNNQGVYWDNFFITPSFNTEMTDAYRRTDGTVVPAAGIWGLRDLARRTFIMMNERQMLPIVFPHMTSFSPLPMLSFCTVQYEWEWKYSEGDVHERFPREYVQLVTTGEQAGVWPVPLSAPSPPCGSSTNSTAVAGGGIAGSKRTRTTPPWPSPFWTCWIGKACRCTSIGTNARSR